MGVVYRAEDTRLGRPVALKVLRPDLGVSPERLERFEREARAASAISHPGVATLYDFHREGETIFLAMELVEGKNLRQILEGGRAPLSQLFDCLVQVSEALSAAHRKGIVHRDLKPENVMAADSGYYKILDFGLARIALPEDSESGPLSELTQMITLSRNLTAEGMISGTLAYMSPEQIQGEAVDARSDIFSFGILLYEMATGTSPFKGKNLLATFHAIVHGTPPPVTTIRQDAPPDLDRIAAKCLAKDPGERYQTAADLAVDLRALRRDSDSGSRRIAGSQPAARSGTARPALRVRTGWIVAGGAILILASLILYRPGWPGHPGGSFPGRAAKAPASIPASALADRSRIAVASFANRTGDPAHDWLSQGLPEMLTTDLARVREWQVISSQKLQELLSAAGREKLEDLDERSAAQLARHAGAGVVISGTIYRMGTGFRVDAQAYDTATGEVLSASRVEGSDIFKIADQVGAGLKKGLPVGDRDAGRPPDVVATSSPEAYKLYSSGLRSYKEVRFGEAAEAFRRALEIDPGFAAARLRLGMSLVLDGRAEEGTSAIRQSIAADAKLSDRERILADGILSCVSDLPEDASWKTRFQQLTERFPRDAESSFWFSWALSAREGNPFEAIRILRETVAQDPNDALAISALARHLQELGLEQEAAIILKDFEKRSDAPVGGFHPPLPPPPPPAQPGR
jgi:TolB-like protein/Tfp pilus assembly protein PilF